MKIDLMEAAYRVMYGAAKQPRSADTEEINFQLEQSTPVRRVYDAFVAIAKQKGKWTGTPAYNCQDFALAMLQELEVQQQQQEGLRQQTEWRTAHR